MIDFFSKSVKSDDKSFSKSLVVEELISGVIKTLFALGLSSDQIQKTFIKAAKDAEVLSADLVLNIANDDNIDDEEYDDNSFSKYDLSDMISGEKFYKDMCRSSKKLEIIAGMGERDISEPDVEKAFKELKSVVSNQAEAQNWYKRKCKEKNVVFAISKNEWRKTATDEMLDDEDNVLFFDETESYHEVSSYTFDSIIRGAVKCGNIVLIDDLLSHIESSSIEYSNERMNELRSERNSANLYKKFAAEIEALETGTEILRAAYIDDVSKRFEDQISNFTFELWLTNLDEKKVIELFKKGNRWCIRKL